MHGDTSRGGDGSSGGGSGLTAESLSAHFEARERRLREASQLQAAGAGGDPDSSIAAADRLLGVSDESTRDTINTSLRQAAIDQSRTAGQAETAGGSEEWRGTSNRRHDARGAVTSMGSPNARRSTGEGRANTAGVGDSGSDDGQTADSEAAIQKAVSTIPADSIVSCFVSQDILCSRMPIRQPALVHWQ